MRFVNLLIPDRRRWLLYIFVALNLTGWLASRVIRTWTPTQLFENSRRLIQVPAAADQQANGTRCNRSSENVGRLAMEWWRRRDVMHGDDDLVVTPLVTMFTTIRNRECRRQIHGRLLKNWAALRPDLQPILFVPVTELNTSASWLGEAARANWTVRVLYGLRHGLPIITAMFRDVIAQSGSPFVGYANSDILFDRSLLSTLAYLARRLDLAKEAVLIIGRRRNIDVRKVELGPGDNLTRISVMDTVPLFNVYAEDYFITNQLGLPWSQIPDFVVGRNGYDNWLVANTIAWNLTVIDASRTLLALH